MKQVFLLLALFISNLVIAQESVSQVFPFAKDRKWGVIDENQKVIVSPKYDLVEFFESYEYNNSIAIVHLENKYGLIDRNGKMIIPAEYDKIFPFQYNCKNFVRVQENGKMGLLNVKDGQLKLPLDYERIQAFKGREFGVAITMKGGLYGAVNADGHVIAENTYRKVSVQNTFAASPDIRLIKSDGTSNVLNAQGKAPEVNANDDEDIPAFEDLDIAQFSGIQKEIIPITLEGKTAFVSIIKYKKEYSKNLETKRDTFIGYDNISYVEVDELGNEADEPDLIYIIARKNNKIGSIDANGNILTPFEYDGMKIQKNKMFLLMKGDLVGLAGKDGRLIYNDQFSKIRFQSNAYSAKNFISIETPNGFAGYADFKGNVFLPKED